MPLTKGGGKHNAVEEKQGTSHHQCERQRRSGCDGCYVVVGVILDMVVEMQWL